MEELSTQGNNIEQNVQVRQICMNYYSFIICKHILYPVSPQMQYKAQIPLDFLSIYACISLHFACFIKNVYISVIQTNKQTNVTAICKVNCKYPSNIEFSG